MQNGFLAEQLQVGGQVKMDARLEDLVTEVERLKKLLDEGEDGLEEKLEDLQTELSDYKMENQQLKLYFEEALQEAERLKEENEQLRVAHQEALLAAQLKHASTEEEKSQTMLAHENEVLEHKLAEATTKLSELERVLKAAEDENDALRQESQRLRKTAQETNREVEKAGHTIHRLEKDVAQLELLKVENRRLRTFQEAAKEAERLRSENEALRSAQTKTLREQSPASGPRPAKSPHRVTGSDAGLLSFEALDAARKDWQELRTTLSQLDGLPDDLLFKIDKTFKDIEVLDVSFQAACQERDQVVEEIQDLNDTVFSKSFKSPSAWAERELKYKMEKKQWENEAKALKGKIAALKKENQAYRDSNKTEEFEAKVQELLQKLKQVEAERNDALHEVHELKLVLKPVSGEFVGDRSAPNGSSVVETTPSYWSKEVDRRKSMRPDSSSEDERIPGTSFTRQNDAAESVPDNTPLSRVVTTVQHFNGQGVGGTAMRKLLMYYAATAQNPLPSIATHSSDPPPEVLVSPTFKEVLHWMQVQGIGPEEVGTYLERQKELDVHNSPKHAHDSAPLAPVNTGSPSEESVSTPKFKEIQRFMEREGIAPQAVQQYLAAFARSKGACGTAIAEVISDDKLPEVVSSPEYAVVFQYMEDNAIAPDDISGYFERQRRKSHAVSRPNGTVDASWRPDGKPVLSLHNFGDVVSYFMRLGMQYEEVHKILGVYCKEMVNKGSGVDVPDEMRASPNFKRVIDYLQAYSVHPDLAAKYLTRSSGVLSAQQADRFSELIHRCAEEGLQPAQVIQCLQTYAGEQTDDGSALYYQALEVFNAAGATPNDLSKYLENPLAPPSPRLSYILDACSQRGMQERDILEAMEQYSRQAQAQMASPEPHALHYVGETLTHAGVTPEEVRLYLQSIETTQASTNMTLEDILRAESWVPSRPSTRSSADELFASRPSTSEYTSTTYSPGANTPLPAQMRLNGFSSFKEGADKGAGEDDVVRHGYASSQLGRWTIEELDELKHDPARLQELIEASKDLPPAERTAVHYVNQSVELERQVSVLNAQIAKMQHQLSRVDDYNFHIDNEVDRALEAARRGDGSALKVLRDRLRSFRQEFDTTGGEGEHLDAEELIAQASLPIVEAVKMQQVAAKIDHLRQRLRLATEERDAGLERTYSVDEFLEGLKEVESEVVKLRDENTIMMQQLVEKKIELAETQAESIMTRRSLLRALEKQSHLSRKIDDLRAKVPADQEGNSHTAVQAKRRVTQLKTGRSSSVSGMTPTSREPASPSAPAIDIDAAVSS